MDNINNIIFTMKYTKSYVSVATFSAREGYQNFLAKYLKDQFIEMNIKQKVRIKIQQININIF